MEKFHFGQTKDGAAVTAYRLVNSCGAAATILDYGCTIQSLCLPDARGLKTDVVLGYHTIREYEEKQTYAGAIVGRFANRIGNGEFTLNGRTYSLARNDRGNHLHGGIKGFDKYVWHASEEDGRLVLTRLSPDGEENYPGNLSVTATVALTDDNALSLTYDAETDADTVLNLTNHSFFNLDGTGTVLHHTLQVFADLFTENDSAGLTTGRLLPVAGTPFDFKTPKEIGRDIETPNDIQLQYGAGYDLNYVLSDRAPFKKAAVLTGARSGIRMTVFTTLPGVQLYSGNFLTPQTGKCGDFGFRDGVCLETQNFPNATAFDHFPSPVLRAGTCYREETIYRFETL